MTLQRAGFFLTGLNLVILLWLLAGPQSVQAEADAGILRGRGLQIVDDQGRIRASIAVMPPENGAGDETVLLRLINDAGQPSIKIGVSSETSSMSLVGGDDQSYVVVGADGPASTIKLVGSQNATKTIAP